MGAATVKDHGTFHSRLAPIWGLSLLCYYLLCTPTVLASELAQAPFSLPNKPVMTMLVMSKDHRLYYEAYNDVSDINGDGIIDTRFDPEINYAGYFSYNFCYQYDSRAEMFRPQNKASKNNKCRRAWSGSFLNYVTTSRMDLLRKSLYGGYRTTDTANDTVLQRAFIPQDSHTWAKEYDPSIDKRYRISDYTPLPEPRRGHRHIIANVTPERTTKPLMRVLTNTGYRAWDWVSKERQVAGSSCGITRRGNCASGGAVLTDHVVRVHVCAKDGELDCKQYLNGRKKPVGVLQTFESKPHMLFGLLTGSYQNNKSGGVLRKNVVPFADEVSPQTGQFLLRDGGDESIVNAIDRLRFTGFSGTVHRDCGWVTRGPFPEGRCSMWGNPIAEMSYETLRYFAGKLRPTNNFSRNVSRNGYERSLRLPLPTWKDPYNFKGGLCAKPVQLILSDVNTSYDGDSLPGSPFNRSFRGDIGGLNVNTEANFLWRQEFGGTKSVIIGAVGNNTDNAPTAKSARSFGNLAGLSPESPTKEGTYHSASVAHFARHQDIRADIPGKQSVRTFVTVLPSHVPTIRFPVNDNNVVSITPFAKSTSGGGIDNRRGRFQPSNTIVDFYVEKLYNIEGAPKSKRVNRGLPYAEFRVNFEDVEQGADHDMDAIVRYIIKVVPGKSRGKRAASNRISVELISEYAAGGIRQHMGYTIAGTTQDGLYLVVRDQGQSSIHYYLNTPPGLLPGQCYSRNNCFLPLRDARLFDVDPNGSNTADLKNPLWYAAKWGGYVGNSDETGPVAITPEQWDADGNGVPDAYNSASNMSALRNTLEDMLGNIESLSVSSTSLATNGQNINSDSAIFQAIYDAAFWNGNIKAMKIHLNDSGEPNLQAVWSAADILDGLSSHRRRNIFIAQTGLDEDAPRTSGYLATEAVEFEWKNLSRDDKNLLRAVNTEDEVSERDAVKRLEYLRGDRTNERTAANAAGVFRERVSRLGDIVNSTPQFIHRESFGYSRLHSHESYETIKPYKSFLLSAQHKNRTPLLVVGSNDGMLHGFDASITPTGGRELFAFIPSSVTPDLYKLTKTDYTHQYYVDGTPALADVYTNGKWMTVAVGTGGAGGASIFALDITNPESVGPKQFMWEFTHPQLGRMIGKPSIAAMSNGKFAVVFTSGHDYRSAGGGFLWFLNIADGRVIKKVKLPGSGNLTAPFVADENGDNVADKVFVGDDLGNLWTVTVDGTAVSSWGIPRSLSNKPLFVAKDKTGQPQPITTAPVGMLTKARDTFIIIGTGSYIKNGDNIVPANPQVQTVYGIMDVGKSVNRAHLREQSIIHEKDGVRLVSHRELLPNHKGWALDLVHASNAIGERLMQTPLVRDGRLIFTTVIPSSGASFK